MSDEIVEAGNFLQSVKSMDEIKEAENVKGKCSVEGYRLSSRYDC